MIQPVKQQSVATGFLLNAILVLGFAGLTAVAAQIVLPWQPVPFTMQTVPVLLSGLLLGARRGYLSQVVYLAGGVAGLPFFASSQSGLAVAIGPTGGYLIAFPICAMALGMVSDAGWTRTFRGSVAAIFLGTVLILGLGWAWLAAGLGGLAALQVGVLPFVSGEVMKAVLVFACLPGVWSGSFRRS